MLRASQDRAHLPTASAAASTVVEPEASPRQVLPSALRELIRAPVFPIRDSTGLLPAECEPARQDA